MSGARPLVSLITPVGPGVEFLDDAYVTLTTQAGGNWEWLIQTDGRPLDLSPSLAKDNRIFVEHNSFSSGVASTRNAALSRAQGKYVYPLDADDILLPKSLDKLVQHCEENPRFPLCVGLAQMLMEDMRVYNRATSAFTPPTIPKGFLTKVWKEQDTRLHYNVALFQRTLLLARSGWPATLGGEDSALLLAMADIQDVGYVAKPILLWRQHAKTQLSKNPEQTKPVWGRRFANAVMMAAREMRGEIVSEEDWISPQRSLQNRTELFPTGQSWDIQNGTYIVSPPGSSMEPIRQEQ